MSQGNSSSHDSARSGPNHRRIERIDLCLRSCFRTPTTDVYRPARQFQLSNFGSALEADEVQTLLGREEAFYEPTTVDADDDEFGISGLANCAAGIAKFADS